MSKVICDAPFKTTPQTPADVLNAAADLLERPGAWTQGAFARNAKGAGDYITGGHAVCWCALGAISKIAGGGNHLEWKAESVLEQVIGDDIPPWNDAPERTQSEVVAKLREAARLAQTIEVSQ